MPHKCYIEEDPIAKQFASDWKTAGIDSMSCDLTAQAQQLCLPGRLVDG
jgi:hypothetical protein